MAKKIVSDLNVSGKKVLIRVDFNVPMKDGKLLTILVLELLYLLLNMY